MPAPTMARLCWSAAVTIAGVGPAAVGGARAQTAEIREWKVPWEQSRPRDP